MSDVRCIGFDIALNHGAAVELVNGELGRFRYYTDSAGAAARSKEHGTRLMVPSDIKDRQQRQMIRLAQIEHWIDKEVLIPWAPGFVGIEDYAIRVEHQAHYMGEIGGIARILVWFRGIPLRLHDPISVKMYATHDGTAQKDAVERAVKEQWGIDFGKFNPPMNERSKKVNRQTSEDLADATAVAKLVWAEYQIRQGHLQMKDLGHVKKIQVFNRVTKTYPINLLGREWIQNPKGAPTPHGSLRERIEREIKRLNKRAPLVSNLLKGLLADGT